MSVHEYTVATADGGSEDLARFAGRHLLIVNVASKCGLTPQYEGLEALYRATKDSGVEVIGFPTNQFLGQEPGTDDEIQDFCRSTYDVTFPVLAKVDVNGENATPLYEYLRAEAPGDWGPHLGSFYEHVKEITPAAEPGDIKWNFTKFLIGRDGEVIKRYEPPVAPEEIQKDLAQYL